MKAKYKYISVQEYWIGVRVHVILLNSENDVL